MILFLGIFDLVKLFLIVFYIAHVFACLWCFIGKKGLKDEYSWINSQEIDENDIFNLYITALYFSIVTMITVGYGDISPKNAKEKIFVIFIMLFACGVFAFSLNRVGTIIQEMFENDEKFR